VEATSTVTLVQKNKADSKRGLWSIFYRIPVGFAALLTPCFPNDSYDGVFLLNKVKVGLKVLEMLLFMEFRLL
jgi:hypothetical protein